MRSSRLLWSSESFRVRLLVAFALSLFALSCRDIQPVSQIVSTKGYELVGTVTSANGIPLGGVDVLLFYNYDFYGSTPIDTQKVVVRDSSKIVDIAVYTAKLAFVRQLFLGYHSPGVLPPTSWDGRDDFGNLVPSGKYLIRYVVDTVIVKYSPVVIDGHVTATTDRNGSFTIGADNLPIGTIFDSYFINGSYDATYEIIPAVDILLHKSTLSTGYTGIALGSNQVTTIALTLQ